MTYRSRQGLSRSSTTFKEEILRPPDDDDVTISSAALFHSSFENGSKVFRYSSSATFDNIVTNNTNGRGGFWGVLARKAKLVLEDEIPIISNTHCSKKPESIRFSISSQFTGIQIQHQYESYDSLKKMDNPALRMGLDRIGDAIGNALEEEKKTQNIILETHNRDPRIQSAQSERSQETQLQASQRRKVALGTAAKVKQLIRELKTVTAELTIAKERCCQLEEDNKLLQEGQEKVDHPADDDMIRVQLETLLAEKGRLAHENSVYARENRFLREIVEFHQMKMQDMVYFYEGIKETFQDPVEEPVSSTQFDRESLTQPGT